MPYKAEYFYVKGEGEQIICKNTLMTPRTLANTIAVSNRNSWRNPWIKRPVDPRCAAGSASATCGGRYGK